MPWGVVPTHVEEMTIVLPEVGHAETVTGHAVAWIDTADDRRFKPHVHVDHTGYINGDL